jgi:hypothetical protein
MKIPLYIKSSKQHHQAGSRMEPQGKRKRPANDKMEEDARGGVRSIRMSWGEARHAAHDRNK